MGSQKIKNGANLTNFSITLLLIIGFFIGMFTYLNYNADLSGKVIDAMYSDAEHNLTNIQEQLKGKTDEIKNNLKGITEAESGFIVAINGFKGLGNILLLPIDFISYGVGVYSVFSNALGEVGIPTWIPPLILTGLLVFLVFLVLSILKGEQQKL